MKVTKLESQKGVLFKEIIVKWQCMKCNNENKFSIKKHEGKLTGKEKGSEIQMIKQNNAPILCQFCNSEMVKGQHVESMMIDNPFFNKAIPFFEEIFLQKFDYSDKETQYARKYLASIYAYDLNKINKQNPNLQQLISLIAIASTFPRSKKALDILKKTFVEHVTVKYNSGYNGIFSGTFLFNGIISLQTNMDVEGHVSELIYNQKNETLSAKIQQKIFNFCVTVKEIFCLQRMMAESLFSGKGMQIHDIYNLLEKYNDFFKFLFNIPIVHIKKDDLLGPYTQIRHAVAHSHYIFQENQIKLVNWEYHGKKRKVIGAIGNYQEIATEMAFFVVIIAQIVGTYQLIYQNREK
jgi:hypothetical protein